MMSSGTVQADIPESFSYQGYITGDGGVPLEGSRQITFSLYSLSGDLVPAWMQTLDLDFDQGFFSATLGSGGVAFPPLLFSDPVWIGITVHDPDGTPTTEMSPRQQLQSSPYSFQSQNSDLLDGHTAAELDQSSHVTDIGNPHSVTAEQVGAATELEVDDALAAKADSDHTHDGDSYTQAEVDAIVTQLQNDNGLLAARIAALESLNISAALLALQADIAALQSTGGGSADDLMQFVTVTGTEIVFSGANVQIHNGSSDQETTNGLGNLTIGYNPDSLGASFRTGSHNLVLGKDNNYTSTGSLVSGEQNSANGKNAATIAGYKNTVSGSNALSLGGTGNQATAYGAVTIAGSGGRATGGSSLSAGGNGGIAAGTYSTRVGGQDNEVPGRNAVAIGGINNVVEGPNSVIVGGYTNSINSSDPNNVNFLEGARSVIVGGTNNSLDSLHAVITGGEGNSISKGVNGTRGESAVIMGGRNNISGGNLSLIAGGEGNVIDSNPSSAVLGRLSMILGGLNNTATGGTRASIFAGTNNQVGGSDAMVVGGVGQQENSSGAVEIPIPELTSALGELTDIQALLDGVTRNGDNLYFDGLNMHLRNGAGSTTISNAKGNLVIGYNELRSIPPTVRLGSHNLVIGPEHSYSHHSGIIQGKGNSNTSAYGVLIGARMSSIFNGEAAAIFGGTGNQASGSGATVLGGQSNHAGKDDSTLMGGRHEQTNN